MEEFLISDKIDLILNNVAIRNSVVVKNFFIGKKILIDAAVIYNRALVDENSINENILKMLMFYTDEDQIPETKSLEYICKKYIPLGSVFVEPDISNVIDYVNQGRAALIIDKYDSIIIVNISGGEYRSISDPQNESSTRGPREGFVENIGTNISLIKRRITDKSLITENFKVGRRSQTDLAIIYMGDIADKDVVNEIRERINRIDVDYVLGTGMLEDYIEDSTYTPFPQAQATERPDIAVSTLMEGQVVIILNGTPFVLIVPAIFTQFFQAVEDYYQRTTISTFSRIIRIIGVSLVVMLPSVYLTLISYGNELIPVKLVLPIAQSRQGIGLPPFLEILAMELIVELLREGGLRLPPRIAATLSIVGGIIIGNAALEAKAASATTLLIVGAATVGSFVVPNYEMALSIRFIRFLMLLLADAMGFLGVVAGAVLLSVHLFSLTSFGVPYFSLKSSDFKDIFIRAPLWKMNKRPESIPNINPIRQSDFKKEDKQKDNEQTKG